LGSAVFFGHLVRFNFVRRRKLDQEPQSMRSYTTVVQMKTTHHRLFLRRIIFLFLPGGKGRPARKADNLTAICKPIV
jgi:hypothetical protein